MSFTVTKAKSPLDDYLFLTKNLGSPFLWTHRLEYTGTRLRAEALGQAALSLSNARGPILSPWFCYGSLSRVPPSYGKAMRDSLQCA